VRSEAAVAAELRWDLGMAALIALGQEAERGGLVRVSYAGRYGRRYERATLTGLGLGRGA
jgi:hypothetical protein